MPHSARSIGGKAVALVWLFVVAVMLVAAHWAGSGPTQGSTSSRRWSPQLRPRLAREEVASATLSAQQFEDHKNGPSEGGNTQPASRAAHSRPQGQAVPQLPTSLGPATAQGSATVVQRTTAPGGGSSGGAPDGKEANPQPAATRGSSAAVTPAPAAANTPAAASTSADVTQPQEPRQQQQKQQTARKAAASLGTHSASISMQHVIPQALEQGKQGQVRVGAAPSVLAPWQLLSTPEALHVAPLRRTTAPGRGAVRAAAGATSQPSTGPAAAAAAAAAGGAFGCKLGPQPSCQCAPTGATPGYHLVVLASPRSQAGRYLASTLLSIAASDARPTTLTVLWARHRPKPGTAQAQPNGHGGTSSLLYNMELYGTVRSGQELLRHGVPVAFGTQQRQQQQGSSSPGAGGAPGQAAGGAGGGGGFLAGLSGQLRLEYLDPAVKEGDVLAAYHQSLVVPESCAEEAGDPSLRDLPLLVLEGDVLMAPRFGEQMVCLFQLLEALPQPGSSPDGSSPSALRTPSSPLPPPDYAISLYLPGVSSTTVNDAMIQFNSTYDKMEKEKQEKQSQQQQQQQQKLQTQQQGQRGKGGGSGGADGSAAFARLAVRPGLWSWGSQALLYSPGMRASLLTHYREARAGCRANDGFQDIILDRHAIARGCAGAPQLGPLTTPPARSGAACDPRVVHAAWVQRLQRIHHPDTTTNAKTNTSSFNSNSSTGAGTGPESTSTHANMATGATDADSDESIVTAGTGTDNTAGMGMGSGTGLEHWSTSCYLLASHPSLVQHVGASSALFGASSSRFHVALDFPTRVAVPGFDGPDGWRRRRHLQRRHRQ